MQYRAARRKSQSTWTSAVVFVWDVLPVLCSHNTCEHPAAPETFWTCFTPFLTCASLWINFWWEMRKTHLCVESTLQRSMLGQGRDVASRCTVKKSILSSVTANPALVFKQLKGIYTSCFQLRISKDVPLCHLIFTYVLLTFIETSSKYRHTFWKKINRGAKAVRREIFYMFLRLVQNEQTLFLLT